MAKKQQNKGQSLKPFAWVTFLYGAAAGVVTALNAASGQTSRELLWFLALFLGSVVNLFALSKAVGKVIEWMQYSGQNRSSGLLVEILFWGTLKFGCLILLGSLIWRSRSVPGMTLVLGLSTLVVVPLFGGYLWSRTDYARRTRL